MKLIYCAKCEHTDFKERYIQRPNFYFRDSLGMETPIQAIDCPICGYAFCGYTSIKTRDSEYVSYQINRIIKYTHPDRNKAVYITDEVAYRMAEILKN